MQTIYSTQLENFLFNPEFISSKLQSELQTGLILRPLHIDDYQKGFANTLSQLSIVDRLNETKFKEIFVNLKNQQTFVIVIEDVRRKHIAAAGTLLVELKFLRGGGLVGHIEDIVTDKEYRGKNLGKIIIEQLKHIGELQKCYKIILDCAEHTVAFYEKCDFKRKEVQMVRYAPEKSKI